MDRLETLNTLKPTAARPLLGLTLLAVEDSLFACDALRLMCLHSGARLRRADCIQSARRHLQVYRPSVIIVDLGLPDGSGAEFICELAAKSPRIQVILGISGDLFSEDIAIAAGADGFLTKPVESVAAFQAAVTTHLPSDLRVNGPRALAGDVILPDKVAYQDDLAHAASLLGEAEDTKTLRYTLQFLKGIARSAHDATLLHAVDAAQEAKSPSATDRRALARVRALLDERIEQRLAI